MPSHLFMSLDKIKDFFANLSSHDLPTGMAVLVGIVLLFLVFRSGKSFAKVLLFLVAIGLFAGAYWWHAHR
jgi:predicted exporter